MSPDEPASVEAVAEWLRKHFEPETARGVRLACQLQLAGAGGGALWLRIDDGVLDTRPSSEAPSDVQIRLAASDFYAVLAGRENSELLFMAGRIQIDGDASLALRLRTYFRRRA
jgi:ubiquinone biosynthesis protein UbiJ